MIMYSVRVVLWLAFSASTVILIRASKISRKKLVTALAVVLYMVVLSASAVFPVENLFYNFKSPESVFNYAMLGEIDEVIYGKESCMVIYSRSNSTGGYYIIPKSENGYKIPHYLAAKKVSHKFDKDGLFDVYRFENTEDYYVFGSIRFEEGENDIRVYYGSGEEAESSIFRVKGTDFVYFYLENFSNDSYLIVNGERLSIAE